MPAAGDLGPLALYKLSYTFVAAADGPHGEPLVLELLLGQRSIAADAVVRRVDQLAAETGLHRDRVAAWGFVKAVPSGARRAARERPERAGR